MASACVKNIGMSPEKNFLDRSPAKFASYGWLSPKISFGREFSGDEGTKVEGGMQNAAVEKMDESDPNVSGKEFVDFEFRHQDPVAMLPADELFSDGKLVPMQLSTIRHSVAVARPSSEVKLPVSPKLGRVNETSDTDPYLFSPKAPRCSSRWRELLGLKRISQNTSTKLEDNKTTPSLSCNSNKSTARSLKHFLYRSSKSSLNSSSDSSLSLPLLKDSDNESVSISSRLSLSSNSSSGHEHVDDLPRLSLDSDKPTMSRNANRNAGNHSRVRLGNAPATRVGRRTIRRPPEATVPVRCFSVDSPRMNSSGKIVFQSLERSSSSPSSFNGGPRYKSRAMERSYSANRKEGGCSANNGGGSKGQIHSRNRTDRTLD